MKNFARCLSRTVHFKTVSLFTPVLPKFCSTSNSIFIMPSDQTSFFSSIKGTKKLFVSPNLNIYNKSEEYEVKTVKRILKEISGLTSRTQDVEFKDAMNILKKQLFEIISLNPSYHNEIVKTRANFKSIIKFVSILETQTDQPQIRNLLELLDKFDLMTTRMKFIIRNLLKKSTGETLSDLVLDLNIGFYIEPSKFIKVFAQEFPKLHHESPIVKEALKALTNNPLINFEEIIFNLNKELENKLSSSDYERFQNTLAIFPTIGINEWTPMKWKFFATQNSSESTHSGEETIQQKPNDPFLKDYEKIILHFIINQRNSKILFETCLENFFKVVEKYIMAHENASFEEKQTMDYLIGALFKTFDNLIYIEIKEYNLSSLKTCLTNIYKYEDLAKRITLFKESKIDSIEEKDTRKKKLLYLDKRLNTEISNFEKYFLDYSENTPVTKDYLGIVNRYMRILAVSELASPNFYNTLGEILYLKLNPEINPGLAIELCSTFSISMNSRTFLEKVCQDLLQKKYILSTYQKISVLNSMANNKVIFLGLFEKFYSDVLIYFKDGEKRTDILSVLLYICVKSGVKYHGLPEKLLIFLESQLISMNLDHKVNFIWYCLVQKKFSNHLKEAIKSVVENLKKLKEDELDRFIKAYYSLKELNFDLFNELNLGNIEKILISLQIIRGFKSKEEYPYNKRLLTKILWKIYDKLKDNNILFLENVYHQGFLFDLYFPKNNIYIDLFDKYDTYLDAPETVVDSTEYKLEIMELRMKRDPDFRYKAISLETQEKIVSGEIDIQTFWKS